MEKKEFRVLIKHCFLIGKNRVEAKAWLDKHYPHSSPGKSTVKDWYNEFKRGRVDTKDAERSGRPICFCLFLPFSLFCLYNEMLY